MDIPIGRAREREREKKKNEHGRVYNCATKRWGKKLDTNRERERERERIFVSNEL